MHLSTFLRRSWVLPLVAGVALPAHAELDSGSVYFTGQGGCATIEADDGTFIEQWMISSAWLAQRAREGSVMRMAPAPSRTIGRSPRGDGLLRYEVEVRYATPDTGAVLDLAASARAGARTDRVQIAGETVGWRVLTPGAGGEMREAWVLSADYAPPLPSLMADPEAAYANGWLRPYADVVVIVATDGAQVAAELESFADEGNLEDARLADTAFTPRWATPAEARGFCRR